MNTELSSLKILDVIGGMEYVAVRRKLRRTELIYFTLHIPMWMVENKEIDLLGIILCEFRRRLDLYRRQVPRKGNKPVRLYVADTMRITVDATSAYCFDRNIVAVTLAMDGYFTNAKAQMADSSMKPYNE